MRLFLDIFKSCQISYPPVFTVSFVVVVRLFSLSPPLLPFLVCMPTEKEAPRRRRESGEKDSLSLLLIPLLLYVRSCYTANINALVDGRRRSWIIDPKKTCPLFPLWEGGREKMPKTQKRPSLTYRLLADPPPPPTVKPQKGTRNFG